MSVSVKLVEWYDPGRRQHDGTGGLPWRNTSDPYRIWVSEVILQQTRVGQGLDYYSRFIEAFPDVETLASSDEEKVLKIWQGLGYYSRARNIHQAAGQIVKFYKGRIPADYDDLIRLPGIGDYTASAILSIAFGKSYPAIDGNAGRVFARISGITDPAGSTSFIKKVKKIAERWISRSDPAAFNQAVMDLGALVCTPENPVCDVCPVKDDCYAFKNGKTEMLPVIRKKKTKTKRYFHYFVILWEERNRQMIMIRKRTGNDIWKNLFEFPMIESSGPAASEKIMHTLSQKTAAYSVLAGTVPQKNHYRHILTHREIMADFFIFRIQPEEAPETIRGLREAFPGAFEIELDGLNNYAVSRLVDKFLKDNRLL